MSRVHIVDKAVASVALWMIPEKQVDHEWRRFMVFRYFSDAPASLYAQVN